ncbi:hypothetical protein E0Z10_g4490 [Xylaria hypoxylon]|uniref:Uncharacterized protein n=1 Tax=Xylaria hypoxylon TaxID=37992 RepID=A0A4Z0YYH3_9PEZI|nr:hypothetical protein E0Z10_g4490 [Xylaria hypoxylon]
MSAGLGPDTNSADQYPIHTGTWTNWSRSRVLGATLTLERQDADLLIAFTAFFIAFIATRTWKILCFAFHSASSTSDPRDVIYHQSQAILRNSSNPEEGIRLFLSLLWKTRHLKRKFIRPFFMATAAIFCVAAFTIAGGFSSRISTAVGNEVLISSTNCGHSNTTSENTTLYHYGNFSTGAGFENYMYTAESIESQYTKGIVTTADYRLGTLKTNGIVWTQRFPLEPASPLGCTDQYQFCSTAYKGTSGCGPLASFQDAVAGAAPFFNTSYYAYATTSAKTETYARFQYFADTVYVLNNRISAIISFLGPRSLLSQSNLSGGFQGPIAPNQWQLDVTHWQDISLAAIQQAFLATAIGPTDAETLQAHQNYTTTELKKLCNSQKIRSTTYASFSLFGLYFTFIPGFLIVLTSFLLEPVSAWLHKRKYRQHAHLEWTTNATLQLQRLAHEEIRVGTWSECTDTIPVTKADELLGCLDITDLTHPILAPPKEIDVPFQAQEVDETPDTIEGDSVEETLNTPPISPSSNVDIHSEISDLSAGTIVVESNPSPQGDGLNTDEETAPPEDQPSTSSDHRVEHNYHASGLPII